MPQYLDCQPDTSTSAGQGNTDEISLEPTQTDREGTDYSPISLSSIKVKFTLYGTLQAVTGPTPDGQCQEFSTKYLLKKACLDEAGHWFLQANDTPLLQNPMIKWFGETGTNRLTFKQVLLGKFNLKPDNIYVKNC